MTAMIRDFPKKMWMFAPTETAQKHHIRCQLGAKGDQAKAAHLNEKYLSQCLKNVSGPA